MNGIKKVTIYSIGLLFIMFLFAKTTVAEQATINYDFLNVRQGPGTSFDQIEQVHTNEVYPIVQIKGDWAEIKLDNQSGWVMTEYITIEDDVKDVATSDQPVTQVNGSIVIKNDNTHIRKGPSTDDEIIHFANQSDTFQVVAEDDDWYEIEVETGSGFLFKKLVSQSVRQSNPLQGKTVVIDAGHGGRDVGSISISDFLEKDFTLKSAIALEEALTMSGANVVHTRDRDDYIRLDSRAALANFHTADAFISIHYNSFPDLANVSGIDTYYYDDYDQQLAQFIQEAVIHETAANDRGIDHGNYQVLRQNFQPAVLLELGFLSNYKEEQLLLTDAYQSNLINGIVSGLSKYFQTADN